MLSSAVHMSFPIRSPPHSNNPLSKFGAQNPYKSALVSTKLTPESRRRAMYFDGRLFGLTEGVRWRIVLAAIVGLIVIPVAIWRLTLTGQTMARVFQGDGMSGITGV